MYGVAAMREWIGLFGLCSMALAAAWVYGTHRRTRRTMETLAAMLDAAMNGDFHESTFDESLLSALETRFAHYLAASTTSAKQVSAEKERIKTLISDLSHQTKTPIANLLLYTELLAEQPLPPDAQTDTAILHAQAEKLRFLIDDLVKLSRLETGILTLHPTPNPLADLLTQTAQQFSAKAADKGLSLSVVPTTAQACFDPKWTAEALCNLVDNAIKYTAQGGVTLSVTAYELFVRVDIADTGMGIAEAEQAKIFSRFYRGERAAQIEGVGIGLYLTREIVRAEGGYLRVSSAVDQGAVFSLFLPSVP